jgi:hypothetical protein
VSLNQKLSNYAVNVEVDALAALLNGGTMEIRSGTQPASANDPPPDGVLLATVTFGNPAFTSGVNGVATLRPMTPEPDAPATGDATWYRCKAFNGATIQDGSAGKNGEPNPSDVYNLSLDNATIEQHARVSIEGFTLTASKS